MEDPLVNLDLDSPAVRIVVADVDLPAPGSPQLDVGMIVFS
jgi:hypothetical protein